MPTLEIAGDHAGCREEHFADGAAALLSFAQASAELVGEPGMFGPMVPAHGLVVSATVGSDRLNGVVIVEQGHVRTLR